MFNIHDLNGLNFISTSILSFVIKISLLRSYSVGKKEHRSRKSDRITQLGIQRHNHFSRYKKYPICDQSDPNMSDQSGVNPSMSSSQKLSFISSCEYKLCFFHKSYLFFLFQANRQLGFLNHFLTLVEL